MEIWPAIDMYDGHVVRLTQGDFSQQTTYAADPVEFWNSLPFTPCRLHLVDLSGAKSGCFTQWSFLEYLAREGVTVEVGGGFRNRDDIHKALDGGANRIVVGTRLINDPSFRADLLTEFGAERIVASLDVKDGQARTHGWVTEGASAEELWKTFHSEGFRILNVTDIAGDGTLSGLDRDFWARWGALPGDIAAGGGVASTDDLDLLQQFNIQRVVIGKAWLDGRIALREVMSC